MADPESGELLKLKEDLSQVIELTKELIQAAEPVEKPEATAASSSRRVYQDATQPVKHWQVGEQCRAIWPKDGSYYEATVTEITTDNEVKVTFKFNKAQVVTSLGALQLSKHGYTGSATSADKKEKMAKQREYLKKKKAKKAERFKQMEEEREKDKNKWQNFSSKAFGKKGFVKKSIFKTPENASGRVGVGTCGVGGQEMTSYTVASKYRRGN